MSRCLYKVYVRVVVVSAHGGRLPIAQQARTHHIIPFMKGELRVSTKLKSSSRLVLVTLGLTHIYIIVHTSTKKPYHLMPPYWP